MIIASLSRNEKWLGAWVGNELMMMSAERGLYLSLSATAGRIWELLEEPQSVEDLCTRLRLEYDISPAQVQREVGHFIEQLAGERIIHVQSQSNA